MVCHQILVYLQGTHTNTTVLLPSPVEQLGKVIMQFRFDKVCMQVPV